MDAIFGVWLGLAVSLGVWGVRLLVQDRREAEAWARKVEHDMASGAWPDINGE